uniref:DNA (cytosine-5-)-methyltransferase n=1 Tax=Cyprinus carpio TaxID=7962 RepID=A0A8C2KTZ3_CYPCA
MKNTKKKSDHSFFFNPATMCFIRKYGSPDAGPNFASGKDSLVLGQKYWEDIAAFCSQTPYCLYLYHGVELEDKEASVVLLGFFDKVAGETKIRLLDVLHPEEETADASLQTLLEDVDCSSFSNILTSQCSLFWRIIQKMTLAWSDLEKYFGSLDADEKVICRLLSDPKIRLNVLFLSHALQPLCDFQENVDRGVSVTQLLQDASQLVRFYTTSFLRPKTAELFHRRGKTSLIQETVGHLPRGEVEVGKQVADFLLHRSEELTDYLETFHSSIISFYMTVTVKIVEGLPFSDATMRDLSLVLSPGKKLEVTGKIVQDLGVCFGVCSSPENVSLLTDEFLEYQFLDGGDTHPADQSMEEYWKTELRIMGRTSSFGKLIVSLLALPRTLKKEIIFEQVFPQTDLDLSERKMEDLEEKDMAKDDVTDSSSYKSAPSHLSPETQGSITCGHQPNVSIDDDDDDKYSSSDDDCSSSDDDVIWTEVYMGYTVGEMVWGPIEGFGLWPGLVQSWDSKTPCGSMCKVIFFGNRMLSEIQVDDLLPFYSFAKCFCSNSFATVATYKDAIFNSLQVASRRSRMFFSPEADSLDELFRVMLDWAFGGFKPSGPDGLRPQSEYNGMQQINHREKLFNLTVSLNKLPESLDLHKGSINLGKKDVYRKFMHPKWNQRSSQTVRTCREQKHTYRNKLLTHCESMQVESRQNSQKRYQMVHTFLENKTDIEEFCLSCGSTFVDTIHPLFEGSLCLKCKFNFAETLYRYDEDGYQSYCTVCCSGVEVILCGHDSCCRCYCVDCLDILVGKGTFNKLKNVDPWTCYLCAPESSSGALKPRHDWSIRVQEFFANNSAMEFEPHRVYPSIPANQRRPIRVLSLFDGIATGYLVLKDLGFKVAKYVSSEVDEESVTISMVNHEGKITYVKDVKNITKKHIDKWGPFDLLIGGSPCNDLCTANPHRKGLFEGTGRLFFEYYRLLNILKPKEDDPQPFFWLFENVVLMENKVKADICRFLECNPVLIDAVKVSPANRARYFWGNIPGMNRPIVASQKDKLSLQECLDPGRTAKYEKIRTITTRPNILKPGTDDRHYPIIMNGEADSLWITELEKIFGFPKHYTDVKNLGRMQRQRVLGKSWSVPVIRHLLAPLKDYFACD